MRAPRTASPWVLLLTALLVAPACSLGSAYERAREHWTDREDAWEDFESRLFVKATYKTTDFREEYAKAYAEVFALDAGRLAALQEAERAEGARYHVVMVAMFTHEIDWDDLRPRKGIWEVRLENEEGRFLLPARVKRLDIRNPTWQRLYPYIGEHDSFWELRFERPPEGEPDLAGPGELLRLVIAGAPATVRMEWRLP